MREYIPFLLLPFAFLGINEIGGNPLSKTLGLGDIGKRMQTTPVVPLDKENIDIGKIKLKGYNEPLITTVNIQLIPYTQPIKYPFAPPKPTDTLYKLTIYGRIRKPGRIGTVFVLSGDIRDIIREAITEDRFVFIAGYKKEDILRLLDIWERWHLNDMNAGTKKQVDAVDEWRKKTGKKGYTYREKCDYLNSIGLLIDNGYEYGTLWFFDPLPRDVAVYMILFAEGKL